MRYFFNLDDGIRDELGTEFADERAAQHEAIRFAGEVLKHEPHLLARGTLRTEVQDEAGTVRFAIEISLKQG